MKPILFIIKKFRHKFLKKRSKIKTRDPEYRDPEPKEPGTWYFETGNSRSHHPATKDLGPRTLGPQGSRL